jgi:hypothetical protein
MKTPHHGTTTRILLGLALAAALASAAHADEGALTEAQVRATLEAQG